MILVTGAGGTIGSALVRELRGHPVRAAYHTVPEGVDGVAVDYSEPRSLRPALEGVDDVFLLGAMSPRQTRNELAVVDAARAARVRRVVKLSVWRADEELTPIARLHRPVERALETSGLAWTFLRPNFFMQNFLRDASAIGSGVLPQPASDAPISFVDARDVAGVAAHVLTSPGHDAKVYPITGPEALTYARAADTFGRVLGHPVRYQALSETDARAAMTDAGMAPFLSDALLEVAEAFRRGGADQVIPTVSALTGREPTALETFAREHQAAFRLAGAP